MKMENGKLRNKEFGEHKQSLEDWNKVGGHV